MTTVDVSVVIVCMNRLDNLYPCLESLRAHTSLSYETLVVAYLFSKENLAKARADFPWVNFIPNDEISGFSENNNLALARASGKYCFVVNDDTEFHENVIDKLVGDMLRLPPETAIVSPKILNSDGSLQLCGRPPYPAYKYVLQQFHLYNEPIDNLRPEARIFDEVYRTYNIAGSAFLIKTSVFRDLGFFDESYFFTPEDIALSTLANERGYRVYVDASTAIVHKWKATSSRILPATRPAAVRGSLLFWSRGSCLRYLAIALPVCCAESLKYLKAATGLSKNKNIYGNIVKGIFSGKSPKELFVKYFNALKYE